MARLVCLTPSQLEHDLKTHLKDLKSGAEPYCQHVPNLGQKQTLCDSSSRLTEEADALILPGETFSDTVAALSLSSHHNQTPLRAR
jgi:hypothetical protein